MATFLPNSTGIEKLSTTRPYGPCLAADQNPATALISAASLHSANLKRKMNRGLYQNFCVTEKCCDILPYFRIVERKDSFQADTALIAWAGLFVGMVKQKLLPLPGLLVTLKAPSCASTMRLAIASPKPEPSRCRREFWRAICANSSKMVACCSADMPMPVSDTVISTAFRSERCRSARV